MKFDIIQIFTHKIRPEFRKFIEIKVKENNNHNVGNDF